MTDMQARIAEVIGPVLTALPEEEQPAFVAMAERIAAGRYRAWADQIDDEAARERLRACADREDDIATRIEAAVPESARIQADAQSRHPELADAYAGLFAGHSLEEQFSMQAQAERTGAATWRAFAQRTASAELAAIFLDCALLEEESAETLEKLVAERAR